MIKTVSVLALQEKLTDNFEAIKTVLIHLGFLEDKIRFQEHKHLINAPRPEENADNPNGFLLYTNSLRYLFTTRSGDGNIFTLVMNLMSVNFAQALNLICKWLDYKDLNIKITYPFEGFYKNVFKLKPLELNFETYQQSDLPSELSLSEKFFRDGISYKVQEKWGIRYDHNENSILIPIHDYIGNLVGCKARNNDDNCPHDKRWFAYLPYHKTQIVYGWYENYEFIQKKKIVVIFEAEKSVLQCASFGLNVAVAIGGHNISTVQARYILSLMADKIIVAFDSDVVEDEVIFETKKLISNDIIKNKVGYIYDKNHELLGDKMSPSDRGREVLKQLLDNVTWLKGENNE